MVQEGNERPDSLREKERRRRYIGRDRKGMEISIRMSYSSHMGEGLYGRRNLFGMKGEFEEQTQVRDPNKHRGSESCYHKKKEGATGKYEENFFIAHWGEGAFLR